MKVKILMVGKTQERYIDEGFNLYKKRISHYLSFEEKTIAGLKKTKNLSPSEVKSLEGELILKNLKSTDTAVLLDENGKTLDSVGFADFVQKQMNAGAKQLVFVVGGAFGFSDEVYQRADYKVSLSKMTFSHQIIRLIFAEQFYRAMTILKNEPYHNA
jgi:23S rRNA (pseudouridine1915-N3)-methyltransferase